MADQPVTIPWHFELFMHKVFQTQHKHQEEKRTQQALLTGETNCVLFQIVEGKGKGTESVKQLDQTNVYWTPSISNFANIDAAIALSGTLYCIQYTVLVSHSFNYHTFSKGFWGELPEEFRKNIQNVVVVFVVPDDVTFKAVVIPESQKDLCADIHVTPNTGIELKFSKRKAGATADDGSNDVTMEDLDDSFADDDCEEELSEDEEEGGTGSPQTGPDLPNLYLRMEQRSTTYNMDEAPLSFLKRS